MQFRNRQDYIHTDLKWSSQYQNGLEMPQLTADWPGHTKRGPKGPKLAQTGLSLVIWTSRGILKPIWHCWDHFRSLPIWLCPFQNPILVCKYLSPLISHKNGSVFKIYIWISVFRRKKRFRNLFLGSRDIKQILFLHFFLNTLYMRSQLVFMVKIVNIWNYSLLVQGVSKKVHE